MFTESQLNLFTESQLEAIKKQMTLLVKKANKKIKRKDTYVQWFLPDYADGWGGVSMALGLNGVVMIQFGRPVPVRPPQRVTNEVPIEELQTELEALKQYEIEKDRLKAQRGYSQLVLMASLSGGVPPRDALWALDILQPIAEKYLDMLKSYYEDTGDAS